MASGRSTRSTRRHGDTESAFRRRTRQARPSRLPPGLHPLGPPPLVGKYTSTDNKEPGGTLQRCVQPSSWIPPCLRASARSVLTDRRLGLGPPFSATRRGRRGYFARQTDKAHGPDRQVARERDPPVPNPAVRYFTSTSRVAVRPDASVQERRYLPRKPRKASLPAASAFAERRVFHSVFTSWLSAW